MKAVTSIVLPGALCAVIVYFSYQALAGEHGLARWAELQADQRRLETELKKLKVERVGLERSLVRLRPETLDLDYVEEIARLKMSYARPDELLVAAR